MDKNIILAMGAEHTDHDKLINIVKTIQNELPILYGNMVVNPLTSKENMRLQDIFHKDRMMIKYLPLTYVNEQKIDGFSYTCVNGRFISRKLSEAKGNEGAPIDKTDNVPHLHDMFGRIASVCEFDIHGELYKVGGTSDDVTRIMGCAPDKAIIRQSNEAERLHYMIHDIRMFNGIKLVNEPWYFRRAVLEYFYHTYIEYPEYDKYIHLSGVLGDPVQAFRYIVSAGGEGLVIKRTNALYVPGKKPANNWIKCKKSVTTDVVIMGFNDNGTGKNKQLFGSMEFGYYKDGELTKIGNVSSGISDELRHQIAQSPDKYIGQVIEIEAMQEGVNALRHPRFLRLRDDKSASECTGETILKLNLL